MKFPLLVLIRFMDVKVELDDEVVVYEGLQHDSQQSTKVSSNKLAKCFPELFKQESQKKPVADIHFRNMSDNPDFLPFPRHVYLRPSIESKNANQFAKELNSIIDVIMGKSDDEEQIEQVCLQKFYHHYSLHILF